jgi:hemin uptake protein HemP
MTASPMPPVKSCDDAPGDRPAGPVVFDSARFFHGRREVQIRHGGEVYLLRMTRNGKLILNK